MTPVEFEKAAAALDESAQRSLAGELAKRLGAGPHMETDLRELAAYPAVVAKRAARLALCWAASDRDPDTGEVICAARDSSYLRALFDLAVRKGIRVSDLLPPAEGFDPGSRGARALERAKAAEAALKAAAKAKKPTPKAKTKTKQEA